LEMFHLLRILEPKHIKMRRKSKRVRESVVTFQSSLQVRTFTGSVFRSEVRYNALLAARVVF